MTDTYTPNPFAASFVVTYWLSGVTYTTTVTAMSADAATDRIVRETYGSGLVESVRAI